ncbi:MAG: hypothetical protein NWF01_07900 [Candidatus Bathyarchaeota archaeon]|nr:hypothetical protein [Candidatus Bathyarchaeota archaeon]
MTKGKPWSPEQEKQLKDLVDAKASLAVIAKKLGKPEEAVRQKMRRLGLEVVDRKKIICSTTSQKLPAELPSVEEMLGKLVAAVNALETPGLDKSEVLRLRGIIAGVNSYQGLLADYLDYRGLEAELMEWRTKYAEFSKKSTSISPQKTA